MKRVEANDAISMCLLATGYHSGLGGLQQNHAKTMELLAQAADLGYCKAHCSLADIYYEMGDLKKAKFHYDAAAMLGHEVARKNLGCFEKTLGNMELAIKHWIVSASAGHYQAMGHLKTCFEKGCFSGESIDSTMTAYNNSCAEMRSKARDAYIRVMNMKYE